MNAPGEEVILEKYRSLPPQRQAEADHFLDFLKASEARAQASERLGQAFHKLDALNLPPMSRQEVEAEIDAARAERRARHADRR
jgi:hypothetical protein